MTYNVFSGTLKLTQPSATAVKLCCNKILQLLTGVWANTGWPI